MDPITSNHKTKRTMHLCFSQDNLKILEKYAKKNGMLDYSQAVEFLAKRMQER
jgi:hypothetical protein